MGKRQKESAESAKEAYERVHRSFLDATETPDQQALLLQAAV
jgi:hypothetical protein